MSRAAARFRPRRWPWLIAAALLVVLIVVDRSGWLLVGRGDDMTTYHGAAASVVRVVDGDTLEIGIPDRLHDRPVTQVRNAVWSTQVAARARLQDAAMAAMAPINAWQRRIRGG